MELLDTNVVSELRKVERGRSSAAFTAWERTLDAAALYISVVTLMELEFGVLLMARRDEAQGAMLRAWLHGAVLPAFAGRILPIDAAIALRCARLHVPDRRGEADALIAATALEHGMAVVTRDVRDFEGTGVRIVNPWAFGG